MGTSGTMDARRNTPSNTVPNFPMEDKRVAVELWKAKVPLKQVLKQAPGLQSHQFATAPAGDQVSVDTADGRHPVLYLKNLVESMPRKLEAVILNEGNSTKY